MSRKIHVKNTIEKFITSTHAERLQQCSFGVEVETQTDNSDIGNFWSIVYDNLEPDDYMNMEELQADIALATEDYISNNRLSSLVRLWARRYPRFNLPSKHQILCKTLYSKNFKANSAIFREKYLQLLANRVEKIEDRIDDPNDDDIKVKLFNKYLQFLSPIKNIEGINEQFEYIIEEHCREDIDEGEYHLDPDDIAREHPHLFASAISCKHPKVETTDDQSVSGKELRTIGGLSQNEFIGAASAIFNAIDDSKHYIDTDCSAHIHIKLGDIKHYYGNGVLHAAIMEYFILNFERLPKRVQQRLSEGNRWIKPALHDNKYTWVNFHEQGTIEFRLFGNIDTIDDLLACQTMAIESLAYAYQVRFGDYKRKTSNDELEQLARAV